MLKKRLITFVCVMICLIVTAVPAVATETRASDQINYYSIDVSTSKDSIDVFFSVVGKGASDKIGCEKISIYKRSGSSWRYVESLSEDDSGMSATDIQSHTNTIFFDGEAGVEYRVIVTIFAENSAGRDTRTKTFYVTGK